MTRLVVGPFNRVEGDLEVKLDIAGDTVGNAHVVSPLYRGFETILRGKDPADALVFTPRICGICSVSQSMAAAYALADASGITAPPNGQLANNLIHAAENVADHLTHFYLFFMPDFARAAYAGEAWHEPCAERFTAMRGTAVEDVLPARAEFLHLMGLLAGKWPHTLSVRPGGTTRAVSANEIARIQAILAGFRRFLERRLFGDKLEHVAALSSIDGLQAWAAAKPATSSDFRHFLAISEALGLNKLGRAGDRFMAYGAYGDANAALFPSGVYEDGKLTPLDVDQIREDVSHGWYAQGGQPKTPFEGETAPDADRPEGYTWCKAPRLDGKVMEVGAIARQAVAGQPLIRALIAEGGGNVHARVVARVLEIALIVIAMEGWAAAIEPNGVFRRHGKAADGALGTGLTEAARGALGHWIRIEKGKIANYQIIAPTTWNFSPRDGDGVPGALEQALVGAPVRPGETTPVAVQHIVRSFDPCMVCTVH